MPPRAGNRRKAAADATTTPSKRRVSKLAKELKLKPEEEDEIREAFDMFVNEDEAPGAIATTDVRKAMLALGFEFSRLGMADILDTLDPENEGIVMWESFIRICALKMKYRVEQEELERAFALFTAYTDGPITIFDLKRIARELKENVTDAQLEDMLLEASGKMTVNIDEFEGVMRRAGVL